MDCSNFKGCVTSLENDNLKASCCSSTRCLLSYDDRKKVVVEENKKRYELDNPNRDKVARFQVDGGMISSQNIIRCDNMVLNTQSKFAVLVELKGTDLKHAFEQVDETLTYLLPSISKYRIFVRIVTSSRTNVPNIKTCPQYVSLNKRILGHRGNVLIRSGLISDNAAVM